MLNCIIAGVGGQGTVFASRLLGMAAIEAGFSVRGSETIGMAQRGGCVVSHLRIGHDISSPLVPLGTANVLLAFEPGEAVRAMPFLSPDAGAVVLNGPVQPTAGKTNGNYSANPMLLYLKEHVERLLVIDTGRLIEGCGIRFVNVALLGAAAQYGLFPFGASDIVATLKAGFQNRHVSDNIRALQFGVSIADRKDNG